MTETYKKKLIEVALPLEAINRESAREKSIRHGHPSTLHLWWSRKPLATCRAVLFASLVDDPSSHPDRFPSEEDQDRERQRLFRIIEELVKWENTTNETVLNEARQEILKSTAGNPPSVLDPFCGGGSIPLEAQRLGLEAHASDLNPVAVLITKELIEIPQRFAEKSPVNPVARRSLTHSKTWKGASGLVEDVRYYGKWIRDEAERRIGHLYPKVKLPKELGGKEATVIAWLWARSVKCPNPACGAMMPLASKWWLSTKKGKATWVEPIVDQRSKTAHFAIRKGELTVNDAAGISAGSCFRNERGKKTKATFQCVVCQVGIAKGDYIDAEADKGSIALMPLAIVGESERQRVYVEFDHSHLQIALADARQLISDRALQEKLPKELARGTFASNAQGRVYGFKTFADYFTLRQQVTLTTFSRLVDEVREQVDRDAIAAGLANDAARFDDGGTGAKAYADVVVTYLATALSRLTDISNSLCRWEPSKTQVRNLFGRQGIQMLWEFAEPNVFAGAAGDFEVSLANLLKALESTPARGNSQVRQLDAAASIDAVVAPLICTDPPYYDNVSYADLSDFFYVWLRRSLGSVFPAIFSTLLVPKSQELVATPYRFGGNKPEADRFFEDGLGRAFKLMREAQNNHYPLTVFYAFKQTESDVDEYASAPTALASTGWETMLEGLLGARFQVTGTWPMRSELSNRPVAARTNALASSIVLVCRPRSGSARLTTRREFINALKRELPNALRNLQHGNIAPVDLAQAAIGPGMAVFSRYSKVIESDGSPMRVRTALQLINQALDEVLAEQESEYDSDTRWAVAWFEQFGVNEGAYGTAETLSKAKNTSVNGMVEAGVVASRGGKVRLLRRDELPDEWDPAADGRLTVWEVTQHLIRALLDKGSEETAAMLLKKIGALGEVARDLAYRLYTTSERKGWAQEALAYNSLVVAWPEITRLASSPGAQESGKLPGMEER